MNYTSRNDDVQGHPDWNQSPQQLNSDATTRADLNGIVNKREQRGDGPSSPGMLSPDQIDAEPQDGLEPPAGQKRAANVGVRSVAVAVAYSETATACPGNNTPHAADQPAGLFSRARAVAAKYGQFIGPGFLISVAYIDPGNYATDVQAGASTRYRHLFIIFLSNIFAIFLQSLCVKLGTVTGLDLAANCRKHLPKWASIVLYILSESAIVATDIAEVIGSAIALNLLFHIPLVAGCAITLVDVLLLLIFYRPDGNMGRLRLFEYFVMALVFGVVVCFCIQLSYIHNTTVGRVFKGYLPSSAIVDGDGVYLSCGILGATVMPHSIFLGSGVVQPRLREFDEANGLHEPRQDEAEAGDKYQPSISAIRSCLTYSTIEVASSLLTFALFVNSAILIVAGSALYPSTEATHADLFGIYHLMSKSISKAAATIFALALLLSGTSAGIVCTMAGQMVSEGFLNWTIKPWLRRLVTRGISIIPAISVAAAVGKEGLNEMLVASQVVLSVILPFVTAPLVWFTCRSKYMTVHTDPDGRRSSRAGDNAVNMRNGWIVTVFAVLIWLVLVVMNVVLLVLVGMGKS
ncbi:hypothetical protein DV735_g300, partial [Chaetothyriales sp. CBS 134920]